jgi:hypothetical protein
LPRLRYEVPYLPIIGSNQTVAKIR